MEPIKLLVGSSFELCDWVSLSLSLFLKVLIKEGYYRQSLLKMRVGRTKRREQPRERKKDRKKAAEEKKLKA